MKPSFIELARPQVQSMQPYQAGKPVEQAQRELGVEKFVKLASNENPRGPSAAVIAAINQAGQEVNRYPDANGYYLKQRLAEMHRVEAHCITLGCGSNDLLELIASAYLDHYCSAVVSQYAFLVYGLAIARSGAATIEVPALDYGHDLAAMNAAVVENTRVIYLANPNNPTGTYATYEELLALLEGLPSSVLVVLDEAYCEYIDNPNYPDGIALQKKYPNLIVTRTFSKAYGLGGLRVGYSISDPAIADAMNRVRQPFNVSSVSLAAAQAALADSAYLETSVAYNKQGMQLLTEGFQSLGVDYIDSAANFVTFKSPYDAAILNQDLLAKGVIVRPLANYQMADCLRVSIGLEDENRFFLQALAELLDAK
ncbi:MAG: histidinol-phosphate transaminase [Pseudomonadota bacterium]|nr:histidinol-phosphate transaminase [Pseudomonadota bacterium]